MDLERDLAAFGAEDRSADTDDVAEVEVHESRELLVTEDASVGHQLDAAVPILQVGENQPALLSLDHQAAGNRDGRRAFRVAEQRLRRLAAVGRLKSARVGVDAGSAQTLDFIQPLAHELVRHDRKRLAAKERAPAPRLRETSS